MGVKGLWQIISNSGKPIALETLEHKILAIDVSIWLHQAVHGVRGLGGSSVANAHLLVLFHRICKLLFYGIKPVFVFDGGVPRLKRQTLSARRLKREIASKKASKVRDRLLANLLKSQAVRNALGKTGRAPAEHRIVQVKKVESDMFQLPPLPAGSQIEELASAAGDAVEQEDGMFTSLHDFDSKHDTFRNLPLQTQHEIMCDLETTRKENSWSTVNEMPQESNSFAKYQMERLLKRSQFQVDLDKVRSQIQKDHTAELEAQLFGELEEHVSLTHRHASENVYSIVIKPKEDQEPTKNIFAEEKVVSKKKTLSKSDFLTELGKQGIVNQDQLNFTGYNSDTSDEEELMFINNSKLEEISFRKALDCVMDNETELSQEEIYSLIQQSKQEAVVDPPTKFNLDKPSTSKQSDVWQVSSSSDDDDFIDVPEAEIDVNISPEKSLASLPSTSNIDVIRQSKSSSLFLKIIQQKLDEVTPATSCSSNRSPQKSTMPEPMKISFDRNSLKPMDDDIFADIFPSLDHTKQNLSDKKTTFANSREFPISTSKEPSEHKKERTVPDYDSELLENAKLQSYPDVNKLHDTALHSANIDEYITDSDDSDSDCISSENSDVKTQIAVMKTATNTPNECDTITGKMFNNDINRKTTAIAEIYTDNDCTYNVNKSADKRTTVVSEDTSSDTAQVSLSATISNENMSINQQSSIPFQTVTPKYSEKDLLNMERNLAVEESTLVSQVQKLDRVASSISEQKFEEAQGLLRLFGIPYIVAPMEAEAQCAFLNSINLTHGTITDDSDIFLFGGKQVYKNFFNQTKHVEVFDSTNVHRLYGLSRLKMIQLAMLTGSDYTVGIESVGAIMAMELLSEYTADGLEGLMALKKTWSSLKSNTLPGSAFRNKLKNLHFPEAFPNKEIFDAYLKPDVDTCTDKFSWGLPNVESLTKFTADKFGWNVSKTSEILVPVLKKIDNKSSQRRLDSYFSSITLTKKPVIKSKRLQQAIKMSSAEESLPYLVPPDGGPHKRKTILIPNPPPPGLSKPDKAKRKKQTHSAAPLKKPKPDDISASEIGPDTTEEVPRPLTKEEKKIRNFQRLLKPTIIPQVEKEKLEKAVKLRNAIKILKKSEQS